MEPKQRITVVCLETQTLHCEFLGMGVFFFSQFGMDPSNTYILKSIYHTQINSSQCSADDINSVPDTMVKLPRLNVQHCTVLRTRSFSGLVDFSAKCAIIVHCSPREKHTSTGVRKISIFDYPYLALKYGCTLP